MNLTQMHERLRIEMLRRIDRGTLTISLLARQTGMGKSHISGFLHSRRHLSLRGIDCVLLAQHMVAEDLLEPRSTAANAGQGAHSTVVPVVSHATALFEPIVRPAAVQMNLRLPPESLCNLRPRTAASRRVWHRFVAVRIGGKDALPMEPVLFPEALAIIDRHYSSLIPYRAGRPNLYAVRDGPRLAMRYADFHSTRLILRPLSLAFPVDLIAMDNDASPGDFIAGRVVMTINEL